MRYRKEAPGATHRWYDGVALAHDDVLGVRVDVVRFRYQCVNRKKRIILLTKHEENIELRMRQYRLAGLIDR